MGGLRINFAEVEGSFDPLEEGEYEVIIDVCEVRQSKSSDNDLIYMELKVTDPEHEGRRLFNRLSFSDKAAWKLKDTFVDLGVCEPDDEVDIEWDDDVDITTDDGPRLLNPELDGLACVAVVTNSMYEGRERNNVDSLRAVEEAPRRQSSAKRSSSSRSSNGSGTKAARKSATKTTTTRKAASKSSKSSKSSGGRQRKLR